MTEAPGTGLDGQHDLRALLDEQARLVSENLEYMGVLSRYARALGLCATLSLEPLCERIVEGLCFEARAQGGCLWVRRDESDARLALAAVRGVLRPREEPETLVPAELPEVFAPLAELEGRAFFGPGPGGGRALYVPLRSGGRLLGLVRLSDRVDAAEFDARDHAAAEQLAEVAALALANALRVRELEQRSLRDPHTGAWTPAFFEGVVGNELRRAQRFGRCLSLLEVDLAGLDAVREHLGEGAGRVLREGFAERLQQALRGSDLCAVDGERRYRLLLPETDALGAAAAKRRLRGLAEPLAPAGADGVAVPMLRLAAATFPQDGADLDALTATLARRLDDEDKSFARVLEREARSFAECRLRLLREAQAVPPQLPEQALRFVLEEVRRRPQERALLWIAPGHQLRHAALEEIGRLRGLRLRAEIVLLADDVPRSLAGLPLTQVPPRRAGTRAPFGVYLSETAGYAWLRERDVEGALHFHTSERVLAEHLAFQLQRDLAQEALV